jgi:hypothetical protein
LNPGQVRPTEREGIMTHNATTERGIIGLTPPSRAEDTARGSESSGGPRVVPKARGGDVEPIITSEVWCYDIISQQSQRERERKKERKKEREKERLAHSCKGRQFYLFERERERE